MKNYTEKDKEEKIPLFPLSLNRLIFFQLGFSQYKVKQSLRGMKLQEKETQKD